MNRRAFLASLGAALVAVHLPVPRGWLPAPVSLATAFTDNDSWDHYAQTGGHWKLYDGSRLVAEGRLPMCGGWGTSKITLATSDASNITKYADLVIHKT